MKTRTITFVVELGDKDDELTEFLESLRDPEAPTEVKITDWRRRQGLVRALSGKARRDRSTAGKGLPTEIPGYVLYPEFRRLVLPTIELKSPDLIVYTAWKILCTYPHSYNWHLLCAVCKKPKPARCDCPAQMEIRNKTLVERIRYDTWAIRADELRALQQGDLVRVRTGVARAILAFVEHLRQQ